MLDVIYGIFDSLITMIITLCNYTLLGIYYLLIILLIVSLIGLLLALVILYKTRPEKEHLQKCITSLMNYNAHIDRNMGNVIGGLSFSNRIIQQLVQSFSTSLIEVDIQHQQDYDFYFIQISNVILNVKVIRQVETINMTLIGAFGTWIPIQ